MLGPDIRRTLTELLTPPPGAMLDAAVGTTYTLNLDAFLAVPALLTLARVPPHGDEGAATPLELLDSLRRTADRMTVFAQAGQIAVPTGTRSRSLFAFLEHGTVPVTAPKGGVFHPKTWALRFLHDDGRLSHRVLVASRNLTFDRSWDAVIAMDEGDIGEPLPGYVDFLRALPGLALRGMAPAHAERVLSVAKSIQRACFVPPPNYRTQCFHALGLTARSDERLLPTEPDRALVVSPFLKRRLLAAVDLDWDRLAVVSRAADLDAELASDLGCAAFELKPDLIGDDIDEVGDGMELPLSGLHAKLFVFDKGRGTTTWVGSANATTAAFNRNVELILELEGSRSRTGVAKWLELAPSPDQATFRSLLQEHSWSEGDVSDTDEEGDTELDRLRRVVAAIPVEAWIGPEVGGEFTVRYLTSDPIPELGTATLRARPLTLASWHGVAPDAALDLILPATLEGLTGFLVYQLRLGRARTEFVVRAELHDEPAGRRSRLIALLLKDPDRLIRYLMLLLRDEFEDRFAPGEGASTPPGGAGGPPRSLDTLPLLERFVRAASRHPETIMHVQQLFADLEETDVVPTQLRELWAEVWGAVGDRSTS